MGDRVKPLGRGSISLAMIVKNEEHHLRGCLSSSAPYVDEMIIVDTGSTDSTAAIAREFGATVVAAEWTGNFSEARNISLGHAGGEWILYLDADERLVNGGNLHRLTSDRSAWAYSMLIQGKHHLATGIVDQVNAYPRLFRRHPNIRFEGVVHEQIHPSLRRLGKKIVPSDVVIEHLGYGESYEKVQEKSRRNIRLLQEQLRKNPQDVYTRYQLGNTMVVMQEYGEAEEHLRAVLRSAADSSIAASACNLLVETAVAHNNIDEAEHYCRQSLQYVPSQTMARWFLSGILAHRQQYHQSLLLLKSLKQECHQSSSTGLSHDLVLTQDQIVERMHHCYDGLSTAAIRSSEPGKGEAWIHDAEQEGILSYTLQRRGLELALAQKDAAAAYRRLGFVINHLPPEAEKQREKLIMIKKSLESAVAHEHSRP